MSDTTISAMDAASLPLSIEDVPCVQGGVNKKAPAAAFGIPSVGRAAPPVLAQYQTWIDISAEPATLWMYIDPHWVALYTIAGDGTLALTKPVTLTLPADPTSDYQPATKHYVDNRRMPGSLVFKGVVDCSSNPLYPAADQGDFYVVGVAGKIGGTSGVSVEVGDSLLCRINGSSSGNQTAVGANWSIGQGNIVGAVTGGASATHADFAMFNGTTGKAIADFGYSVDSDPTMAANSGMRVPTQSAVKSSIGGNLLSGDTLQQGQGWFWDGYTSTLRARDNEGKNLLVNPSFDIWQENTSYAIVGSGASTPVADYWKIGTSAVALGTVSLVAGIFGSANALKFRRTILGSVNSLFIAQQLDDTDALYLAGKTVTVSFDFSKGANYSPTFSPVGYLFYGTGTGEVLQLNSYPVGFATGSAWGGADLSPQVAPYGSVARIICDPIPVPSNARQVAIAVNVVFPSVTPGADDSFTIGNVKMEVGAIATAFQKPTIGDELKRCQWRYQKSFVRATAPAQNAGLGTGEVRFRRLGTGTASEGLWVPFKSTMRGAPAITLYNPAAANAQLRNITGGADCGSAASSAIGDGGFIVTCTGNSGGAVGDWLGVHYVADARL